VRHWILGIGLLVALGCGSGSVKLSAAERLGKAFGDAIVKGDWEAVQSLTSTHWQKKWSLESTKALFNALSYDLEKASGKDFVPKKVEVKSLELPKDVLEARERFGVTTNPPIESWKAFLEVRINDPETKSTAVAPMLVVDESKALKIAFVAFRRGE
jgi:hypothetical protein